MSYTGKLVFAEYSGTKSGGSGYNNGEYFILRETPCTLYGVKLNAGYGGHSIQQLPKIGEGKFTVIESWQDNDAVRQWAKDSLEFVRKFRSGEANAQWIESVYSDLEANARAGLRVIETRYATLSVQELAPDSMEVNVPAGIKKINLKFT